MVCAQQQALYALTYLLSPTAGYFISDKEMLGIASLIKKTCLIRLPAVSTCMKKPKIACDSPPHTHTNPWLQGMHTLIIFY